MASEQEVNNERENEEGAAVSMVDVLQEEQQLEEDANAVLGDSDDKECTYNKVRRMLRICSVLGWEVESGIEKWGANFVHIHNTDRHSHSKGQSQRQRKRKSGHAAARTETVYVSR